LTHPWHPIPGGITAPSGFRAAAVTAGLKASGKPDVALVVNDGPLAVAAAVFTANRFAAAPVAAPVASCSIEQASGGVVGCGIGADGAIGPADLVVPMAVVIVIPLLLAYLTRFAFMRFAGKESLARSVPRFSAVGNAGLLVTLFVLMGLSGNKVLFSRPEEAIAGIVPVLLYYAGMLFSARAVSNRLFPDAVGRAVFFGSYLRYVTLALGFSISISFQDEKLLPMTIVIVLAYLVQIPSSARIADRMGGIVDGS